MLANKITGINSLPAEVEDETTHKMRPTTLKDAFKKIGKIPEAVAVFKGPLTQAINEGSAKALALMLSALGVLEGRRPSLLANTNAFSTVNAVFKAFQKATPITPRQRMRDTSRRCSKAFPAVQSASPLSMQTGCLCRKM